jgi:hypothetical protein
VFFFYQQKIISQHAENKEYHPICKVVILLIGKELIFILKQFSYLNLKKLGLTSKELFTVMNPGAVTVRMIYSNAISEPHLPVTENVAVQDNTVNKVILPGITSSRTRNPPEEWLPRMLQFARTLFIRYLPGITRSRTRNPSGGIVIPP